MTLPVIDLNLGKTLCGGKENIAIELITLLRSTLPQDKADISDAYIKKDWALTQRLVHRLHGAVCYCGTPALKAALLTFEIALKEKNLSEFATLYQNTLRAIDDVLEATL